jgi:hypothetical protein
MAACFFCLSFTVLKIIKCSEYTVVLETDFLYRKKQKDCNYFQGQCHELTRSKRSKIGCAHKKYVQMR